MVERGLLAENEVGVTKQEQAVLLKYSSARNAYCLNNKLGSH